MIKIEKENAENELIRNLNLNNSENSSTNKNQNISDSVPNEDLPDDNNNLNDFLT